MEALAPGTPGAPNASLPSIESVILEKLLTELETRQLTRVQPAYIIEQPAARHTILIRTLWSLLWVLSILVCIFSVKYIDSQTIRARGDDRQLRSIENLATTMSVQKQQFSTMIDSLQGLAGAIAASSQRTAAIPDLLNRLGSDLKQIRPPLARRPVELAPEAPLPAVIAVAPQIDSAPIPMGGHHHPPIDFSVAPVDVVVHHNALGVMDYWLVPRMVSGARIMAKAVPISQTDAGTFVHHIEEVKDYLVTPAGDWIPASDANGTR
jgi:hypothetical protein